MSHIPNSAMPHAGGSQDEKQQDQGGGNPTLGERAGKIADYARENPKTAIAAGAALAAGALAAAAIPLVRSRSKSSSSGSKKSSGGSASGGSKSGAAKTGGSRTKE